MKKLKKKTLKIKSYEIENINFEQINIDIDKEYFQEKISVINEGVSMYFFLTAVVILSGGRLVNIGLFCLFFFWMDKASWGR